MAKKNLPSLAQAKYIARAWAGGANISVMTAGRGASEPYVDPTVKACIARGWIAPLPNAQFFEYGHTYLSHKLTDAAIDALEEYFREQRYGRNIKATGTA